MKISLLSLSLFIGFAVHAQQIQYGWRNYTTNDGLPSPEVYTVIQDSKGYIWFGTDNGVSRFDGYSFQNFGTKQGLGDNVINGIQEDAAGRIWFCSMWGKLYYFEKDSIYAFRYNHLIQAYQKSFFLTNGFTRFEKGVDTEGGCLLGLEHFGILKITDDGKIEHITAPEAPALLAFTEGKKKVVVNQCPVKEERGMLKSGNFSCSIFLYDGEKLVKQHTLEQLNPSGNFLNCQMRQVGNRVFLFGINSFYRFDDSLQARPRPYDHKILDILTDEDGQIWTAEGDNTGVKAYPNAEAIGTKQAVTLLDGITPVSFLRDRDGGYWVTSLEEGVFYLRDKRVEIFNQKNTSFPFEVLSAVAHFDKSKVFIGFRQGEVGVFDKSTLAYQKIDRLPQDNITDMKWDARYGKLWIGGNNGFKLWQNGQLKTLFVGGVKRIALRPQQDAAWLLTHRGLSEAVGSTLSPRFKTGAVNVQSRLFSVFEDSQNRLWISKHDGLYRPEQDSLVAVPPFHPALQTRIDAIAELPNGSLVFATKGKGLVIWDGKTTVHLSQEDGLQTDMLENLATDAQGNIWVGTLAGLHKLSLQAKNKWRIQPLNVFHGLPTNEINDITLNTEGVFLATPKGLVFYRDTAFQMPICTPFLTAIKARGKNADWTKPLSFASSENDIELFWNAINFRMSGKINYRYRFSSSASWTTTLNRSLNLAALSAGAYRFELQAQNEDGLWSPAFVLDFTVRPIWYATVWFRAILLLLVIAGSYLFYKNRLKNLLQKHSIELKINNLERSALATQMNPHFIFNCLNSIQFLIQSGSKGEAMTYLSRFAKLVRFVLESTRHGKVSIDEDVEALENYLSLEKLRFQEGLHFSITVADDIDGYDIEIPAMLIQPFVENALKHAFTGLEKTAIVAVQFEKNDSFLIVKIQDNGKGYAHVSEASPKGVLPTSPFDRSIKNDGKRSEETLSPAAVSPTFNPPKTGVGISLSRQRLYLHNGREDASYLVIESILGEDKSILGTVVQMKILV